MIALNRDGALAHELIATVRPDTIAPHTAQWFEDDTIMVLEQRQLLVHAHGRTAPLDTPPVHMFWARGRSWLAQLHDATARPDAFGPLIGLVHNQPLPATYQGFWGGDIAESGDVAIVDPIGHRIQILRVDGGVQYAAPGLIGPPRFSPDGRGLVWPTEHGWDVAIGQARLTVRIATMNELPVAALFAVDDVWWIAYQVGRELRCHPPADPTMGHTWSLGTADVIDVRVLVDDQVYLVWQDASGQVHREPGFAPGFDAKPFAEYDGPQEIAAMPSVAPFRFYAVCVDPFGTVWSAESYIDDAQTADVRVGIGESRTVIAGCPALGYLQIAAGRTATLVAGTGRDSSAQTLTVVRPDGRRVTLGPTLGTQQVQMRYLPAENQFYVVAIIDAQTWGAWWLTPDLDVARHTTAPLPQGIRGTSQGLLGITTGLEPVFTDQHRAIIRAGQSSTLTTFSDWYGQGWSIGQGGPKRSVVVGPTNTPAQLYIVPYEAPVPSSIAIDATGQPWVGITGYGVKRVIDAAAPFEPAPTPTPEPPPPPIPDPETPMTMMLPADVHATYAAVVALYPHTGGDDRRREMHKRAVSTVRARHGLRWITKSEHNTGWDAQSTDALGYVPGPVPMADGTRVPMFIWDMINGTTRAVLPPHESEPLREAYALLPQAADWLGTSPTPPDPQEPEPEDPTETDDVLRLLERLSDMEQALHARIDEIKAMQEILQNLILLQREHVSSLHSAFNQQAAALARGFQAKGRFLGMPITLDVTPKPPAPEG